MDNILNFYKHLDGKFLNADNLNDCAKRLMCEYSIVKGDSYYQIGEIEFYYYSPNHKDIITYPRHCFQGLWFFHSSGVDLTIQSSESGMNPSFGGILIRSIIKYDKEGNFMKAICGPQKSVYELFDYLNAVDNSIERTPMLKRHTFNEYRDVVSTQRYIPFTVEKKELKNGCIRKDDYQGIIRIKAEVKLQKILEDNSKYKEHSYDKINKEWLITLKDCNTIDSFLDYLKANYRFYLKNIPWERGYNAVNIDNKDNCYKFLFV